jgi:uncharacterized protein CbrC (UPF0167 family)
MSVQVDAVISAIVGEVTKTQNAVAHELLSELVVNTPVDTGEAQAGWYLSGEAEAMIVGGPEALGVEVSVANDVDHIQYLADGSSPQAPAGWIEATVERVTERHASEVMSREVKL